MVKAKVILTHSVEIIVEGNSLDEITDWMRQTTPDEAKSLAIDLCNIKEHYEEEAIKVVNQKADYVIK